MDDILDALFDLTGRTLTPGQIQAFEIYENELCEWNQKINLTAIRDRKEIQVKHFLDSLTLLPMLGDISDMKLIDIGTGAGFPGIPIKICEPAVMVALTDSVGKKLDFCRHIIEILNLNGITTIQARAEDLGQSLEHREHYDRATARAVASMPVLVEFLLPLLKIGGKAVIQKGENGFVETQDAKKAIKILGGELELINPLKLPGIAGTRYLIMIRKVTSTPKGYPRRAGIPAGKPI